MSKYNNIKSIPIEMLSEEELNQAIKEWSEGDESMEKLLWSCYRNGVKTSGCHAGGRPYLGIEYEKNSKNKIVQLINSVLNERGTRIYLSPDGGNPFSGPSWYKPDIAIGSDVEHKEEADQFFDIMSTELQNSEKTNLNFLSVINLFDFLIGKYSGIKLYIIHTQNNEYIFSITKSIHDKEMNTFPELNQILTSSGLMYNNNETPHKNWEYKSNEQIDFLEKINIISENIINNYTLKKPESIEDVSSLNLKAHIKKDESTKNGNEKEFDLWLMNEEAKINEEMGKDMPKIKDEKTKNNTL